MKKIACFLICTAFSFGCQQDVKKLYVKKPNPSPKELLWKRETPVDALSNVPKDVDDLAREKNITVKNIDGLIYVSAYFVSETCSKYSPTIEIKNDSLFLRLESFGSEACTDLLFRKAEYLIDNPKNKEFKIRIKYPMEK